MCECPRLVIRCHSYWGGFGGGETPLPIPNREVKPSCADGTARDTGWESRSPPLFVCRGLGESPRPLFFPGRFVLRRAGLHDDPYPEVHPCSTFGRGPSKDLPRKPMRAKAMATDARFRRTGTVAAHQPRIA